MVKYNINEKKRKMTMFDDLKVGEYFMFVNCNSSEIRLKVDDDTYISGNRIICLDDTYYNGGSFVYPLNAEINLSYVYEGDDE